MFIPQDSQVGATLNYIALANSRGVNKLAAKEGYGFPGKRQEDRFRFLTQYCAENPDTCFEELARIHPDFDMIAESILNKLNGTYQSIDEFDSFIGEIAGGVSQLGAAGIGKIGEKGRNEAAKEASRQESKAARFQAAQAAKDASAKQTKYIIIGSVALGIILLMVVIFVIGKKKGWF